MTNADRPEVTYRQLVDLGNGFGRLDLIRIASTALAVKNLSDFRRGLHAAIRGYWKGQLEFGTAVNSFMGSIERGFTRAWRLGAAEFGITPADYSPAEESALRQRIVEQDSYVMALFSRLVPQARGGLMRQAFAEAELFVARFEDVRNQARTMAARDAPLEWILGMAEHCDSCMRLAGKVKRGSWWVENGILPRRAGAWYLQCRGYRCQCSLVRTDKGLTRGAMPGLP